MKKNILSLVFTILAFSGYSQLEFTSEASVSGNTENGRIDYTFTITNTGDSITVFWWDVIIPDNAPRDWNYTICDKNVCYEYNDIVATCDDSGANKLEAGESITYYKVSVLNQDEDEKPLPISEGSHDVVFRIIEDCAVTDPVVLGEITITFTAIPPDAVDDLGTNDQIKLYPNPTTASFQVSEDQDVKKISVFSILGRHVADLDHRAGEIHDVSYLESGMYLMRMIDKDNETMKVMRLDKK